VTVLSVESAKLAQWLFCEEVFEAPLIPSSNEVNQAGQFAPVGPALASTVPSTLKSFVTWTPEPGVTGVPKEGGDAKLPPLATVLKIIFKAFAPAAVVGVGEGVGLAEVVERLLKLELLVHETRATVGNRIPIVIVLN
jgi:hypothetical protein